MWINVWRHTSFDQTFFQRTRCVFEQQIQPIGRLRHTDKVQDIRMWCYTQNLIEFLQKVTLIDGLHIICVQKVWTNISIFLSKVYTTFL